MLRLSSVTHAFNMSQYINKLSFSQTTGGLNVTAPPNGNVAPPGYYLLFILNGAGVPSVAKMVQLTSTGGPSAGALQFSAATFSVAENVAGGNATITVTRTGGSAGAVGVSFATSNGTATAGAGADYTAVTQTVSFANGDTANKTISIPINNDTTAEANETVNLALSNPTGGATLGSPSTAVLTITDNDVAAPTLSVSPTTIAAGGTVTATWSGIATPTATDWIGLYTPGAANTAYIDWIYVSCSQTPGAARASGSCPFVVPTTVAPGTYQLRLLANDGFTTLLATSNNFTVTGGGGAGALQFSAATFSVAENVAGGNATITVTRTGGSAGAVGVSFATSNGTATAGAGADYTAVTQTVSFANGDTANKTISIPINNDTTAEANETVNLALSNPTGGATLGSPSTAVLTITDNDAAAPTLSVSPTTIAAGGTVTATWSGIATPTATDWIGLYTPGAANTAFIDWIYVSCSQTPGAARASGSCPFLVPTTVAPGTYQLRLLANDGFTTLLATSNNFTVTGGGGASTGFLVPSADAAVSVSGGDNNGFQTAPSNAYVTDGQLAIDTDSGTNKNTSCTNAGKDKHNYFNYNFNVPGGASIRGIEVRLDARVDSAANSPRMCVQLSWNGGTTWTTALSTTTLTTTTAVYILGGATNTWGRTWTAGDFSNANFRVRIIDVASSTARDFSLDGVAVQVTHQ